MRTWLALSLLASGCALFCGTHYLRGDILRRAKIKEVQAYINTRRDAACSVPVCPSVIGYVSSCMCGSKLYRRGDDSASSSFCCKDGLGWAIANSPCSETLARQSKLTAAFCSPSALSKKSGLILPFELAPGVIIGVHREAVARLEALRTQLLTTDYEIKKEFTAAFMPRKIHGTPIDGEVHSTHAFGIAIDLNWDTNPYCPLFPSVGRCASCITGFESDIPAEVVVIFEENGFAWGGRWATPDPMHFELKEEYWTQNNCS